MTAVNTVLDAFVAPSALFERFEYNQRQSSIVLVILFGLILASYYLFFAGMTDEWLLAQQLGQVGDLSIQEREIAQEMMVKNFTIHLGICWWYDDSWSPFYCFRVKCFFYSVGKGAEYWYR